MFEEFPNISKKEWINKIERDLKNKSLNDVILEIGDLKINPFLSREDLPKEYNPVLKIAGDENWKPVVEISGNPPLARRMVTETLKNGAECLFFRISKKNQPLDLKYVCEDVDWKMIQPFFKIDSPGKMETIVNYFNELPEHHLPKRIQWIFPDIKDEPFKIFPSRAIPGGYSVHREPGNDGSYDPQAELSEALRSFHLNIDHISGDQEEYSPFLFILNLDKYTIPEISKFRAFRVLLANYFKAMEIDPMPACQILAYPKEQALSRDPDQNLIQFTSLTVNALLGSADFVLVRSQPDSPGDASDYHRLLLNISHLLRHESQFDYFVDPVAGSYIVEFITKRLVESSWNQFMKLV